MNCSDVRAGMPAYARGELDPKEHSSLEEHIKTCAECATELEDIQEVLSLVESAEVAPAPREDLKVETLARVHAEELANLIRMSAGPTPPDALKRRVLTSAVSRLKSRGVRPGLAWVLAAAAVTASAWAGGSWFEMRDMEDKLAEEHKRVEQTQGLFGPIGHEMQTFPLSGPSSAEAGLVHFKHDNFRLRLEIDGFKPSPSGHHYEMWMTGRAGQVSLGSFRLVERDDLVITFPAGVDPAEFPTIVMTLERNDGDPTMSDRVVATATLDPGEIHHGIYNEP